MASSNVDIMMLTSALRKLFDSANKRPDLHLDETQMQHKLGEDTLKVVVENAGITDWLDGEGDDQIAIQDITAKIKDSNGDVAVGDFVLGALKAMGIDPSDDAWWEEDLQYKSLYLDRKDELEGKNANFLQANQAVKQMCSDFLVHLLQRKPDDVFIEAESFFSQFAEPSALQVPQADDASSQVP